MNFTPPQTRQNTVGPLQNMAQMSELPAIEDNKTSSSLHDEVICVSPWLTAEPTSIPESVIQESIFKKPMDKKGKGAQKVCILGSIPPGGMLNTKIRPGKSAPAMEHLDIQEFSNHMYWRFAPYLEEVCCTVNLTHKRIADD